MCSVGATAKLLLGLGVSTSFGLVTPISAQGGDPRTFYTSQMVNLTRALNDPTTNSRVQSIWLKLVRFTNQMYPVLPAQQYTMGQALPNGVVLLDVSVAGDPDVEVTAFWLAHEYGHQVLGHLRLPPNWALRSFASWPIS